VAPKPDASRLMLVSLSSERNSEDALDSLHASVTPTFTHLLNPDAGQALLGDGVPPAQFLAIAFDGHSDAIAALSNRAKQALSQFAFQIIDLTDDVAALVRVLIRDMPMRPAPLTVRCNILPSQVGAFARMLEWTARRAGFAATVFGDALAGIVYAHIYFKSGDEDDSSDAVSEHSRRWTKLYPDLRDKIDRVGGSAVFERMPQYWRDAGHPVWLPESPDIALMRGIKSQLDPHGIFRPGCYVDHI